MLQHLALVVADAAWHTDPQARTGSRAASWWIVSRGKCGGSGLRTGCMRSVTDRLPGWSCLAPGSPAMAPLGSTGIRFEFADQQLELLDRVVELLGGAAEAPRGANASITSEARYAASWHGSRQRIGGDLRYPSRASSACKSTARSGANAVGSSGSGAGSLTTWKRGIQESRLTYKA